MKVEIEKLGRKVEAPKGYFRVLEGVAAVGDLTWDVEREEFGPLALYNIGHEVDGFWCVLRRWVDEAKGI